MKTAWEDLPSDPMVQVSSPSGVVFHLFLLREEKELMQGHRLVLIQTDPLTGARQLTCSTFVEEETRCKTQRDLPNAYSSPVECLASIRRALGLSYSHIPRRERKFIQKKCFCSFDFKAYHFFL